VGRPARPVSVVSNMPPPVSAVSPRGRAAEHPRGPKRTGQIAILLLLPVSQVFNREVVTPMARAWSAEREILGMSLYQALREVDPATHATLLKDIKAAVQQRRANPDAMAALQAQIPKFLARSSDEAVLGLYRYTVRQLSELNQKAPADACWSAMFQGRGGKHLTPETQKAGLDAMEAVIRSSAARTEPVEVDVQAAEALLTSIMQSVAARSPDAAILAEPQAPNADKKRICELSIEVFEEALRRRPPEAAVVLRFMAQQ
jgi:hypothetical protein